MKTLVQNGYIVKTLEMLVLSKQQPLMIPSVDPLQFAYQTKITVIDAIIYILHQPYTHLAEPDSSVRIMFLNFSSAFKTIRPTLLTHKLMEMCTDDPLVSWIAQYLTGQSDFRDVCLTLL